MLFDGLSLGEETIVKRGFVADLSMIGADVEKLAFRSKDVTPVLREKSHKIFSAWKIKKRTCQCTKYTKQKKKKGKTSSLFIFHKIQIHVPIHKALHGVSLLGRSDFGDVVFWFSGPRKAPG